MASMRLLVVVGVSVLVACGDDGAPTSGSASGTDSASEDSSSGDATITTTSSATSSDTSSDTGSATTAPAGCDGQPCGLGCTPDECPTVDCSGWACSEEGECLPPEEFVCDASIIVCEGLSCGDECVDPFCDDSEGGMCAVSRCDADGVCSSPADFEQNPCVTDTDTDTDASSSST